MADPKDLSGDDFVNVCAACGEKVSPNAIHLCRLQQVTLRDQFAMAALQGILAQWKHVDSESGAKSAYRYADAATGAKSAYRVADAMMEARK